MYVRRARLLPSVAVALMLSLFGVPTDPPGPFVESVDAQTPLVTSVAGEARLSTSKITLNEIRSQKRGEKSVLVLATAGQSGLTCRLKIKYRDGNTDSPDEVVADSSGVCTMHFDVTTSKSAVGTATAKLNVVTNNGFSIGSAKRTFSVR